jgi:hypothetical protein
MAYDLSLPRQLANAKWKVKIRDKERLEEPHLTILKGTDACRIGLRSRAFLDGGRWSDFPTALRKVIEENWDLLCDEWDAMYPNNPVQSDEENDHDEDN